MNRNVYRLTLAAAWILAGTLFAVPLWDHWYYHGGFAGSSVAGPVGALTAYPVAPEPSPPLRSPAVTGPTTSDRVVSAPPEQVPVVQATGLEAPARDRQRPMPAQGPRFPVNVARSRQAPAPSEGMPSVHPPASRAPAGSREGRGDSSSGAPVGTPAGLVAAGIGTLPPKNGSSPNQPVPARAGSAAPTDTPRAPEGQAHDPRPPAEEPLRLALVPQRTSVAPGDLLPVAVLLEGGHQVTSVPFHLKFNPEVLEYVGVRTGPVLSASSRQPIILASVNPNRPGDLAVGLSLVSSSGTISGSGTILLLDFRALAHGVSDLVLERASVRGPTSEPLPADIAGAAVEVR